MIKGDKVNEKEQLLRRVYRIDKKYRDPKTGKPSSRAFAPRPKKDDGKLSVDIERLTTIEKAVIDPLRFVLYRISASFIFKIGLNCIYDPILEENFENIAHAVVIGFDEEDESLSGILARKAELVNYQ
ncbi:MAG: hypothetical protein ACFCUU_18960 [Cyclobacteriaceae bacterium]